jgi:hypothetical protein
MSENEKKLKQIWYPTFLSINTHTSLRQHNNDNSNASNHDPRDAHYHSW